MSLHFLALTVIQTESGLMLTINKVLDAGMSCCPDTHNVPSIESDGPKLNLRLKPRFGRGGLPIVTRLW